VAQPAQFAAVHDEILDTTTTAVTMIGAKKGTALVGMGGVGKTTLAAALVRDQEIQQAFPDGICWLTLGQEADVLELQRQLLAWIAPGSDPPSDLQSGHKAFVAALKTKRWLIVLDDLWREEHLRAFELADTPSRLLVTTRDYGIARSSGATHVVDELTDSAARAFLAKAVGLEEPELPATAAQVIRECGCLPLALALAGATLTDSPRDEALWRDVVAALVAADHEQLSHEFSYPYPHALAAIQASVDFLPPEDKAAYLQLAIFPEDSPIPLEPLEKLWGIGGLRLRNRVRLFVDRALARRHDDDTILLHDLQGDFVRKRCPDVPAAHEALLRSYRPDESLSWVEIAGDGYLLDRLPYHLAGAGRGEECRDLLFDLAWLRHKLAARGVLALIADTGLCPGDAEVERLGRTLRMSAHVLNREPRELTAQLLGRLGKVDGNRTARLLDRACRELPPGILIPCGAGHLLPPGALLQTLEGHSSVVYGAVLSADGARALSWSYDHTLRLWDLHSFRELARFTGDDPLTCCVVSGDDRLAVVGDSRGRVLRFDLPA
jgi:NB-ARC domain-containing protein/apoptotic protease-activating factor 1-like protein/WD40 domain-containing protein